MWVPELINLATIITVAIVVITIITVAIVIITITITQIISPGGGARPGARASRPSACLCFSVRSAVMLEDLLMMMVMMVMKSW